jgi:GT2 family glycosyltransferase
MVDNGSVDGSPEKVESEFPQVKVIRAGKNLGFAGGNNFGIPHCHGRYVFFLNNDTRLHERAMETLAESIARFPGIRIFACFLLNYYKPDLVDSAGDTLYTTGAPFSFQGYPASLFTEPRPVLGACAGAAVYAREVLEKTGGFDPDFFLIFEDLDLSLRARHLGYDILFLPDVKVFHKSSASLGGKRSPLAIYYCERNLPSLLLKDLPLPQLLAMLPAFSLLKSAALIKAAREGNLAPFAKGTWHALREFPGNLRKRLSIMSSSRMSGREFRGLLRRNWLKERLAFRRGNRQPVL